MSSMNDQSSFLSEEHLASLSRSQVSEEEWRTLVATWRWSFFRLLAEHGPSGWSGRTSPVSCRRTKDGILEPSSGGWRNSGMGSPTEYWTLSTSEYPKDGVASS